MVPSETWVQFRTSILSVICGKLSADPGLVSVLDQQAEVRTATGIQQDSRVN
jgi:hypothetical protein